MVAGVVVVAVLGRRYRDMLRAMVSFEGLAGGASPAASAAARRTERYRENLGVVPVGAPEASSWVVIVSCVCEPIHRVGVERIRARAAPAVLFFGEALDCMNPLWESARWLHNQDD